MNIADIKYLIEQGKFDGSFKLLYSETEQAKKRYISAVESFEELYGNCESVRLFSAPGRTEIGGNHTDHQHGSVLAASVNLDVIAVVSLNNDGKIRVKSEGYSMDTIEADDFSARPQEKGRSAALIRGVCRRFSDMGCKISGFNAYTVSNVLKGSGLSSSAAFEVLLGNILNGLFNDNRLDSAGVAKIGQFAEKEYFGKPCGLLDQMASALGGFSFIDFGDPVNPVTESIKLDVNNFGYTLCVVDTGGNHSNLTQDYADITVECREISNALGVEFLRDANIDKFYGSIGNLRKKFGDRAVLRAHHFFSEHERVVRQREMLKCGRFEDFLKLVNQSGDSSFDYLQNLYSISNASEQGMPLAIALTKRFLNGKGACRVHGGGFAGTIQCYIPTEQFEEYKFMIEKVFGQGSCSKLFIRPVGGYELRPE